MARAPPAPWPEAPVSWRLVNGGLLLLALAVVLVSPLPPGVDFPMHLGQGALLLGWDDPGFVAPGTYCARPFAPYHAFHHLAAACLSLAGPLWGGRLLIALTLLAYTLGAAALLRAAGTDRRLFGLCLPLFFGFSYAYGFGPNLLALAPALGALALALHLTQSPRLPAAAGLCALLLLAWLLHPLPFYLALAGAGLILLFGLWRRPRALAALSPALLLPGAVALAYLWTLRRAEVSDPGVFRGEAAGVLQRLAALPRTTFGGAMDPLPEQILAALLLVLWAALVLPGLVRAARKRQLGLLGAALLPWALYLTLPTVLLGATLVYPRLLQPALLLPLLLFGRLPRGRPGASLSALGGALCAAALVHLLFFHLAYARQLDGLLTLAPRLPRACRALALVPRLRSRLTREHALRHAPALLQLLRGGELRYSFAHFARMPVTDCDPAAQAPTLPLNFAPWRFDPARHGPFAHCLVIYLSPDRATNAQVYPWLAQSAAGARGAPYRVVRGAGPWLLLRHAEAAPR